MRYTNQNDLAVRFAEQGVRWFFVWSLDLGFEDIDELLGNGVQNARVCTRYA